MLLHTTRGSPSIGVLSHITLRTGIRQQTVDAAETTRSRIASTDKKAFEWEVSGHAGGPRPCVTIHVHTSAGSGTFGCTGLGKSRKRILPLFEDELSEEVDS